jgi:hypothetical protein
VYVCDADGNGERDPSLATANPEFFAQCPVTNIAASKLGRKLVWLDATVSAPLYFLQLLGFHIVPMTSSSIAEAASIDLVIVIDTSQSMANATVPSINGDPTACNATDTCEPLLSAKNAANSLIDTLYPNYDQVAIVGFDVMAKNFSNHLEGSTWYEMRTNLTAAKADVANLKVHDDPDPRLVWYDWSSATELVVDGMQTLGYHFNPVYPEDRDGDGLDADPNADPKECDSAQPGFDSRWQDNKPCDMDTILDAFNGDDHGTDWGADPAHDLYTPADTLFSKALVAAGTACDANNYDSCNPPAWTKLTVNSTCTGCGIRVGAQILKRNGRPKSVWVMVFLSDGVANLSDTSDTVSDRTIVPAGFKNGFCNGGIDSYMWSNGCLDTRKQIKTHNLALNAAGKIKEGAEATSKTITVKDFYDTRFCIDTSPTTCPPGSQYVTGANVVKYSVYDYALDMADYAALSTSLNRHEVPEGEGSDISIFSIGLGDLHPNVSGSNPIGEYLLRYLANVGTDNDRSTDECEGKATEISCGQYYYAPSGAGLRTIFNDISKKIFTRLTK